MRELLPEFPCPGVCIGRHVKSECVAIVSIPMIIARMDNRGARGDNEAMTGRKSIEEFLAHRRLAVVGVSRSPKDFTRLVFREFRARGYEAVPVNPNAVDVEGERCYARVGEIDPPVEAALLLTPPAACGAALVECAAAGIRHVWMYRPAGTNSSAFCRENGMSLIAGRCPLMFLPNAGGVHRFHGLLLKIVGRYPAS